MKKNTICIVSFSILLLVGISQSCNTDKCLNEAGDTSSKFVETGRFDRAEILGIFDVVLVQDTACFIELKGGDKILDFADVIAEDSMVSIQNSNTCFFLKDYEKIKCYIHFIQLNSLIISESCKVESLHPITSNLSIIAKTKLSEVDIELNNERFKFYNYSTSGGDFKFHGKSDHCNIDVAYIARMDARELECNTLIHNSYSVIDSYMNASDTLVIGIYNSGNIYYANSPVVKIDSMPGSGRLIQL